MNRGLISNLIFAFTGSLFLVLLLGNMLRFGTYQTLETSLITFFNVDKHAIFSTKDLFTMATTFPNTSLDSSKHFFELIGQLFKNADHFSDYAIIVLVLPIIAVSPLLAALSLFFDAIIWLYNLIGYMITGTAEIVEYWNLIEYLNVIMGVLVGSV